jgi:hypothetical protein
MHVSPGRAPGAVQYLPLTDGYAFCKEVKQKKTSRSETCAMVIGEFVNRLYGRLVKLHTNGGAGTPYAGL